VVRDGYGRSGKSGYPEGAAMTQAWEEHVAGRLGHPKGLELLRSTVVGFVGELLLVDSYWSSSPSFGRFM